MWRLVPQVSQNLADGAARLYFLVKKPYLACCFVKFASEGKTDSDRSLA